MRTLAAIAVTFCAAAGPPVAHAPGDVAFDGADVVVMGEVHDNPAHHANQAAWVTRLNPAAIVFEMMTPLKAERIARIAGDDIDSLSRALDWAESGWPDFSLYHPIILAAPDAVIFGGDVPRDRVRQAMTSGAAQAMGAGAALFGLDIPLPRVEAEARETVQAEAHCGAMPPELLPGMVEVQRLRDAALAEAVVNALLTVGGPVAVITGDGHARTDHGMPRALRTAMPEVRILSIGQFETMPDKAPPFDLFTLSDPHPRADPCLTFR